MNKSEFANYQRLLNAQRVNKIKSTPKLSPKVLLNDEDFDVSLGNIPITIPEPPQEMTSTKDNTATNQKENPLF